MFDQNILILRNAEELIVLDQTQIQFRYGSCWKRQTVAIIQSQFYTSST